MERVIRTTHEVRADVNEQAGTGLNWLVRKLGDRRIIMHGGATAGYKTQIAFDPDKRVGFVRLTNTNVRVDPVLHVHSVCTEELEPLSH